MTTLVAPSHTVVDSIPLGRRIAEIMKEKGMYYSISAMANRVGIGRETFRLMLKGDREIYTFELEKIAKDLKISMERLLQEDIKEDAVELRDYLNTSRDHRAALAIALRLEGSAIGATEKSKYSNLVGNALYLLRQYEEAHEKWLEAYPLAQEAASKDGNTEILLFITANLMLTYTIRKDFTPIDELIREIEPFLSMHPDVSGSICFTLAEQAMKDGDMEKAGTLFRKTFEIFEQAGNPVQIGKSMHNIAYFEYKMENYHESKKMFEKAIPLLKHDPYQSIITIKDYSKALLELGEHQTALQHIEDALGRIEGMDSPEFQLVEAKLLVLKSRSTGNPEHAEGVLKKEGLPEFIRKLAGDYLIHFYAERNDLPMVMAYYEEVRKLCMDGLEV